MLVANKFCYKFNSNIYQLVYQYQSKPFVTSNKMFQRPRIMSSSLPPRQRGALLSDSSRGPILGSPLRQSNREYQLVVEFELRRQKQKTFILEERLRNKEIFIKQMKEFQDELTSAFEKCQEQLISCKKQCQNYETKFNSYSTFNQHQLPNQNKLVREYLQEIAELKHLVIRLEEEINFHERKNKNQGRFHTSAQKQFQSNNSPRKNRSKKGNVKLQQQENKSKVQNSRQIRSKTQANQFNDDQGFEYDANMIEEISNDKRKIASFIGHFMTMVEFFDDRIKQGTLKQRLKKAWKWIKGVVVQWNQIKKGKTELCKNYRLGQFILRAMPISTSVEQAEEYILKLMQKQAKISVY